MAYSENEGKKILSFVEMGFFPFMVINRRCIDFLLLTAFVSFICSTVAFLFGRSFLCSFSGDCVSGIFSSVVSFLVFWCGLAFFVNRWFLIAFEGVSFAEAVKKRCLKQDLRAMFLVFLYLALWGVIGFSLYFLEARKPFADWRLELLLFIGVSFVIIFAVILLLNSVIFLHYLQGENLFVLNKTFWPVLDNIFKMLIWFFIYFFVFVFCLKDVFSYFLGHKELWGWLRYWGSEFCMDFFIFAIVSILVSALKYIELVIFSGKK